ncbi:hypothetical protein [Rurimicrobium arvi]|uniref:Uncharacterized protein n=1 Tax=Rurimicrobium arvi TaxID=2049916 RepID=A0ABP8MW06_9BACT
MNKKKVKEVIPEVDLSCEENNRLTAQELITYPGCEQLTEQEAQEITSNLHLLAELLYGIASEQTGTKRKLSTILNPQQNNQQNLAA